MSTQLKAMKEYEKLIGKFKPKPRPARDWARLARAAGMKYMAMTTKHHEGFCQWDSKQTDFNAVTACKGGGNLLLNIGPSPKGDVPADAIKPLTTVGN